MEVSGVVFRPAQCFSGGFYDAHSFKISFSSPGSINSGNLVPSDLWLSGSRRSSLSARPRKSFGIPISGFSDNGHLQYYVSTKCGGKKEAVKEKGKNAEKATIKKKLKYLKGLSRNLLMFPEMGFVDNGDGVVQDHMRKTISDATDTLLAQLKQVKKLQKKKKMEEQEKLKAAPRKIIAESESSSSSSSSPSELSDCEGEVMVNMNRLRSSVPAEPTVEAEPRTALEVEAPVGSPNTVPAETNAESPHQPDVVVVQAEESCPCQSQLSREAEMQGMIESMRSLSSAEQGCCSSNSGCCSSSNGECGSGSNVVVGARAGRIDVCLGGKCRKMGGAALLEELERSVGGRGSVVGCKCMGKCRSAPNVRVLTSDSVENGRGNPLYIGVGLEDVGAIVSKFFGEKRSDLSLMAT